MRADLYPQVTTIAATDRLLLVATPATDPAMKSAPASLLPVSTATSEAIANEASARETADNSKIDSVDTRLQQVNSPIQLLPNPIAGAITISTSDIGNTQYQVRVTTVQIPQRIVVHRVVICGINKSGTDGTPSIQVALYSFDGNTKLFQTGYMSAYSGAPDSVSLSTDVVVGVGTYRLAWTQKYTGAARASAFRITGYSVSGGFPLDKVYGATKFQGYAANNADATDMPATLGAITVATGYGVPLIMLTAD